MRYSGRVCKAAFPLFQQSKVRNEIDLGGFLWLQAEEKAYLGSLAKAQANATIALSQYSSHLLLEPPVETLGRAIGL